MAAETNWIIDTTTAQRTALLMNYSPLPAPIT